MKSPWLWRKDGIGWGQVCIRGTGIQAGVIYDRWQAGETVEELANDYNLPYFHIIAAINFELGRKGARARREALEGEA